jgi:hypothetical protein
MSGRGLWDELIPRPVESYRLWGVVVCDIETSWMRTPWPNEGCSAKRKKERKLKLQPLKPEFWAALMRRNKIGIRHHQILSHANSVYISQFAVASLYVSHRVARPCDVMKTFYFKSQIILTLINEGCSRICAMRWGFQRTLTLAEETVFLPFKSGLDISSLNGRLNIQLTLQLHKATLISQLSVKKM